MAGTSNTNSTHTRHRLLVAFGSNLPVGDQSPESIVRSSLESLEQPGKLDVTAISRLYRTPALPAGSGPDFVNGVIAATTDLTPPGVLERLHAVEQQFQRQRQARWAPRTLDLDLLAHGDAVLPDPATEAAWRTMPPEQAARQTPPSLILPHPRLAERAFVLVPLAELAPGWRHPVTGCTAAGMLAALDPAERAAVRPLPAEPMVLRRAALRGGRPSAATRHIVGGAEAGPFHGIEILRTPGAWGVELRYLDAAGAPVTDTWHACLADALAQAEAEFGPGAADRQSGADSERA